MDIVRGEMGKKAKFNLNKSSFISSGFKWRFFCCMNLFYTKAQIRFSRYKCMCGMDNTREFWFVFIESIGTLVLQ